MKAFVTVVIVVATFIALFSIQQIAGSIEFVTTTTSTTQWIQTTIPRGQDR